LDQSQPLALIDRTSFARGAGILGSAGIEIRRQRYPGIIAERIRPKWGGPYVLAIQPISLTAR
jgi:hypothetical protein